MLEKKATPGKDKIQGKALSLSNRDMSSSILPVFEPAWLERKSRAIHQ